MNIKLEDQTTVIIDSFMVRYILWFLKQFIIYNCAQYLSAPVIVLLIAMKQFKVNFWSLANVLFRYECITWKSNVECNLNHEGFEKSSLHMSQTTSLCPLIHGLNMYLFLLHFYSCFLEGQDSEFAKFWPRALTM